MVDLSHYTGQSAAAILEEFKTQQTGLTSSDVETRKAHYGPNVLEASGVSGIKILIRQFTSPFIYLLFIAAVLAFFLGEKTDGALIIIFVCVNGFLGFYQEFRSEHTLELLKKFIVAKTTVIRDGKKTRLQSEELVPGDILVIGPGDNLPADVRFIQTNALMIDESALTGESAPVEKTDGPLSDKITQIYDALNLGFSGTTVSGGSGLAVVVATGGRTIIGDITHLTTETERESIFEKEIARFSSFTLRLIICTLFFVVAAHLLLKPQQTHLPTLLIFSIALAVSVIPEALPVVMTFSLSRGALKLAKNKVVVKRLSSIEDLGSIEVLCCDKTGTLTENNLTVDEMLATDQTKCLQYACLAAGEQQNHEFADPFDIALWRAADTATKKDNSQYKTIKEIPFDPERRRNTVLVATSSASLLISRGAFEEIAKLCKSTDETTKKTYEKWIAEKGKQGRRVIAIACKTLKKNSQKLDEQEMKFIGLISFIDPIKKTTGQAVIKAKKLGVAIKIVTGDSREVAGTVAHQIGLITDPEDVITGVEFDLLPVDKQLEAVQNYTVFARVSPQQKYAIIKLLKERFEVGFLGEGINDAPALKIAHVGLAVSSAADVSREAADIVLLKKSLVVIIDGIHQGREIFTNTTKYIKATLSSNFGNFYTVAIVSLLIDYLPILPIQLLLINLLTDFPMIAISTDTVDSQDLKRPRSYDVKEIALVATILGVVSTLFDFIFFILFYRISPTVLQTNWFIGSVLTELVFMYSIRSRLFFLKAKRPSATLSILTFIAFITAILLPFSTLGHVLFKFVSPTRAHLVTIFIVVSAYFATTESVKLLYYRFINQSENALKQH